jgi:hypothetical protein
MARNEEIGKELEAISRVVAGLPAGLPYTVPSSYFQHFPEQMLDLIRNSEEKLEEPSSSLLPSAKKNPFETPSGYFDGLAEKMLAHVLNAEAENSPEDADFPSILIGLKEKTTFRTPEGYFDLLAEKMLAFAQADADVEKSIGEQKSIDAETWAEEIQSLSPLLASMSRTYPGAVPEGYFESLSPMRFVEQGWNEQKENEQRTRAEKEELAPVIPLQTSRRTPVRSMLAAAVTLGTILMSAVWGYHIYDSHNGPWLGSNLKTTAQITSALSNVSDQAIEDYLKNNSDVSEADLMASDIDLQQVNLEDYPDGVKAAQAMGLSLPAGDQSPSQ